MKYKIEFELPDNEIVRNEIKYAQVNWNVWGYSGQCLASPIEEPKQKKSEKLKNDINKISVDMGQEDFGTLCICAIRYCQGRRTYMPSLVLEIITPHLPELSDKDLGVMVQDCNYQRRFNLYGDEHIDLPGWLEWEQILLAEIKRKEDTL